MNETQLFTIEKSYARIVQIFISLAFIILFLTFVISITGILPNYLAYETVADNWNISSESFVEKTEYPVHWNWIYHFEYGDILNFASLALLAFGTIVCFLFLSIVFLKNKDYIYAILIFIQIIILLTAASGVLYVA